MRRVDHVCAPLSSSQNGGCLDQPYKRCMRYDGVHSTFMRWGTPRIRPFKGFAVRMLEHINQSYPHRRHQINNSALDATPAQNALPCLFSHLPTTLHVVILEFGSMAFHLHSKFAARSRCSLRRTRALRAQPACSPHNATARCIACCDLLRSRMPCAVVPFTRANTRCSPCASPHARASPRVCAGAAVEGAARMLLSLNPRPLLIFLSMHEWCQRLKDKPRTLYVPGERLRGGYVYPDTPWSRAEAEATRVCALYGQACLSVHRALEPNVRAGVTGFGLSDVVGDDCLHPTHGVRGAEYVADILSNAFDQAAALYSKRRSSTAAATPIATLPTATIPTGTTPTGATAAAAAALAPLPAPLHAENLEVGARKSRCYGFVKAADYRKTYGQSSMYRALQPIQWISAWCAKPGEWVRPNEEASAVATADAAGAFTQGEDSHMAAARGSSFAWQESAGRFRHAATQPSGTSGGGECAMPPKPAVCPRGGFGPSPRAARILRQFLRHPPKTWFWCYSSLATSVAHQKKSPGVLALSPGATLHFPIDSRMASSDAAATQGTTTAPAASAAAAAAASVPSVVVRIEHLVSYEHMGIATVRCVGRCACDVQRIDAHRTDAHRNVSVFLQHAFPLRGSYEAAECALQLQVLPETSSGGHKFKVRTVTLSNI